jgi:thiol-disulfide isomerase/thioredoxin
MVTSRAVVGSSAINNSGLQLKAIADNTTLANDVGVYVKNFPAETHLQTSNITIINGKPVVIFYGAQFCPYCAVSRWGMVLALMRFGNFSKLTYMLSSPTDVYPNTPTFTFYKSSYESNDITFESVGTETRLDAPLQTPNKLENATFSEFDLDNSAIPQDSRGGIPFIDFGNYSYEVGALILPSIIDNLSWSEVISSLSNPNTAQSKNIIGIANIYTAQICEITNFTEPVCKSSYVSSILKLENAE